MATIFVDINATGDADGTTWEHAYTNLQTAINAAIAGDSLWVKWGVYTAPSGGYAITTNNVSIYGGFDPSLGGTDGVIADRTRKTVIDGASNNRCLDAYIGAGEDGDGLIDGFSLFKGAATDGAGIRIRNQLGV